MSKKIMLTVSDSTHEILMQFARITGKPATKFIYQALEEGLPKLRKILIENPSLTNELKTMESLTATLSDMQAQLSALQQKIKEQQDSLQALPESDQAGAGRRDSTRKAA